MAGEDIERRLAAVLSADVVGYSRLMGEDDAGTFAAVKALRKELFAPTVVEHHGRIVKLMGDGALVEFPSVVNAVECAVAVQRGVAERNAGVPEDKCIALRIGVNLGDIIIEGGDIYGDGVNVAARLQELAAPGGIALSATAHEHAVAKINISFQDGGEHKLKNIAKPVRIYHWSDDDASRQPEIVGMDDTLPLPHGPSVAVLPFENKSGDPDQAYFADGLTENIINGLTRFREILVIADKSILIVREQASGLREIGQTLGVAHIVEGSVRKAGDRVRVTAHLVEAATGHRLWGENFDRNLDDIFAIQDEITDIIVTRLAGQIEKLALRRTAKDPSENPVAYDYVLRGRQCLNRYTRDGNLEARRHFERALELDPDFASAYAGLSICFVHEYMLSMSEAAEDALDRAYSLAQKAVALDDADSQARYAMSWIYYLRGQFELAEVHTEKALELNPNDYHHMCQMGFVLASSDRSTESIECLTKAMRLNPLVPDNCLFAMGMAEYSVGRYEEALAAFGKVRGWGLSRPAWIAACYAQLGRDAQAQIAAAEVRELAHGDSSAPDEDDSERWRTYWSWQLKFELPDDQARFLEGLRKAGLPA
jgi:TolB-like protein/Tfp pilus assembly protein PilF